MRSQIRQLLSSPNLVTFSRLLVALAFFQGDSLWRILAVSWAAISDILDGWLARRLQQSSLLGAIFDPLADKFFVFFSGYILFCENRLDPLELLALFARDIVLFLFALYLAIRKLWGQWKIRPLRIGKAFTALQFLFLGMHCIDRPPPYFIWAIFPLLSIALFTELMNKPNSRLRG